MQSELPPPRPLRSRGVYTHLRSLGLRTYNKEPGTSRAIFKHDAVLELYRLEIPRLFGILLRDEGSVLDRGDPNLFDKELETLLQEFGPRIWPKIGEGDREHLLEPQAGTMYDSNIVYPRDTDQLKDRLRSLILAKNTRPGTDIQALIEKRHKDANMKVLKRARGSVPDTSTTRVLPGGTDARRGSRTVSGRYTVSDDSSDDTDTTDSGSEDSVIGVSPTKRAYLEISSHTGFSGVELRLYRKLAVALPGSNNSVLPYGFMFLTADCTTSSNCFTRICEKIQTDCDFIIFQLPEDMSVENNVRVNRGSSNAEATFQRVLDIFRKAKKFPGEPQYRSVEVEVGLDMPRDD